MKNWGACLKMGAMEKKSILSWCSPPCGVLKFNVDGVTNGKPGLAGIGGVLRNHKGEVLYMFSKHIGIKDSNEVEVMTIYHTSFHHYLIVESDSANAISWVKSLTSLFKLTKEWKGE